MSFLQSVVVWPFHDPGLAAVKGAQPRTVWTGNWLQVWDHLNVCKKKRDIKENPAPPGVKRLLIVNNVVLIWLVVGRVLGGIQALASDMPVTCGIPNPGTCTHMEGCLWLRVSLSPDLLRTIFT